MGSTRRSPCGDSEQCESLTENGKRCRGQIWQPLILAGPFLEVQSLVGPALTSSSGRRLDQELLPPSQNNRSNIVFHLKNHLLQKFRRTKIELSLITSLELPPGLYCTAWQPTSPTNRRQRSKPTPRSSCPPSPASTRVTSALRT